MLHQTHSAGLPRALLAALLVSVLTAIPTTEAVDSESGQPVELSAIPPGSGAVVGSVLLRWSRLAGDYEVAEQRLYIFSESMRGEDRKIDRAAGTARAKLLQDIPFVFVLPAGVYDVTFMHRLPKGLTGWRPKKDMPLTLIGMHFEVRPQEIAYVGRLVIEMPSSPRAYTLSSGLMHVEPSGFRVEDARQEIVAALEPKYGQGIALASTRLARAPDDLQTGPFERLVAGDQVRIGANHWELSLPPGVSTGMIYEESSPRQHTTRLTFDERVSWINMQEGLEVVLWERDNFWLTPRQFFEQMRNSDRRSASIWRVLFEDDAAILYEARVPRDPPKAGFPTVYGLYRIVVGEQHALSVMYFFDGEPPEAVEQAWQEALLTSRTKH